MLCLYRSINPKWKRFRRIMDSLKSSFEQTSHGNDISSFGFSTKEKRNTNLCRFSYQDLECNQCYIHKYMIQQCSYTFVHIVQCVQRTHPGQCRAGYYTPCGNPVYICSDSHHQNFHIRLLQNHMD